MPLGVLASGAVVCEVIKIGLYNPYAPQILGQEWAPIRNENVVFPEGYNPTEYGHSFDLTSSQVIQDGRIYVNEMTTSTVPAPSTIAIYPAGGEALSGPIQRLVIPVEQVLVTGATPASSRTGAQILLTPEFTDYYLFASDAVSFERLLLSFNTGDYNYLNGKRILAVNLLYGSVASSPVGSAGPNAGVVTIATGLDSLRGGGVLEPPTLSSTPVKRMSLGAYNYYWQSPVTADFVPWNYTDLARLDSSSSNRMFVEILWGLLAGVLDNVAMYFWYAALEVLFCEERRLAVGIHKPTSVAGGGYDSTNYGANIITLRDITTRAINPVLPAGPYVVTASQALYNSDINACRELYPIPTHTGIEVDLRYPPEDHLDETFVRTETRILPQISVHTSGGPLTEVHAYGRQAIGQVYGSITVTQEILDSAAGGAVEWPHVRFYARRFGETTVPLLFDSPTIVGSSVTISPAEFDELPEIIDGWKEITLRFDTPPSMGAGTNPQWRWSATDEISGNRWEILGATAPAVSGIAGNLFNLVPSPHQLSSATYGRPSAGATINMGWIPQYAPPVTATADDETTDAVILFAQDMRTITGLSVSTQTQELTGIGLDCDLPPCCIPTDLLYHRITWPLPYGTGVASDEFGRTEAAGSWGTADSGQAYSLIGTATDFSVSDGHGKISPTTLNSQRIAYLDVGGPDQDVSVNVHISDVAGTGRLSGGVVARFTDANNYYRLSMRHLPAGVMELTLVKMVAGVETTLQSFTVPLVPASIYAEHQVRLQVSGSFLRAKVWAEFNGGEPDWWQITTTDTDLTTGNYAGCYSKNVTAAIGAIMSYSNFQVGPPDFGFGYYELQRSDTVDTDWATIMKATAVATTGFSDYEARASIDSSYRIRAVDVYGFEGSWSEEVSIYLPTPGASGGCIDQGHVMLFTSNERQDGSINLAYASAWEANQTVDEAFQFPEANFVQMQAMYDRDYFVAFRPLERGGERFQRTLLVQAAAISPPTLGDFRGLRDMAWDTVSYICVRDEGGNRWFSTVIVPGGRVLRDRRLYLAPVDIIEVTDTPSEVDP